MRSALEIRAAETLAPLLAGWLGVPIDTVEIQAPFESPNRPGERPDLRMEVGNHLIVAEIVGRDDIALLERAEAQLRSVRALDKSAVLLIVAPYVGPKAQDWLKAHELSWIDLSKNADIRAEGLRILVTGNSNAFASPGRPSSAFAPRSSRIARALLLEPDRWWRQRELAQRTGLLPGHVSKVVQRLRADGLLEAQGVRLRARDPKLLLESWMQHYELSMHELRRFHVAARNGQTALGRVAEALDSTGMRWATTGLAAAWKWTHFADFRVVSAFVDGPLLNPEGLGLHPVERGENVWILVPHDDGVFEGASIVGGVPCVHPIQVVLDLTGHGERAREAAEELRTSQLCWSR